TKLTDLATKPEETPEDLDNKMITIKGKDDNDDAKKIEVSKPDGISEELWDKEKGTLITAKAVEELNKQTKMASDMRKKMSKGLKADVPEKAEDYVINLDKDFSELKIGEDEQGKLVLNEIKNIGFKNNMSQSQLDGFVNDYFKMLIEKGIVQKPLSEAEQKIENDKFVAKQKETLGDNAQKIIDGSVHFIHQNYKNGIFSETEKDTMIKFLDGGAENILIFDKLRKMTGEPEIPTTHTKIDGLPSDAEIARKMNNNEYTEEEKQKIFKLREKAGKGRMSAEHF
ncbi:MAG TPA: hypothetical protein VMW66_02295, partial [Elusimicrobiales bacterium]|nr:hypothetical protein [Elusimicrobiales bacterium]